MNLTLIRHCEVQEAYHGCYNGHIDIGLSKKGYEQAKHLAKTLHNEHFDAVFCSDLLRAKESIKYFKNLDNVIYTDKLREKSWGEDEGKTYDEICHNKNISYENFEQWIDALDGESIESVQERVSSFFFDFLKKQPYNNVLVVTHSGIIKTFYSTYEKIPLKDAFSKKVDYAFYKKFLF